MTFKVRKGRVNHFGAETKMALPPGSLRSNATGRSLYSSSVFPISQGCGLASGPALARSSARFAGPPIYPRWNSDHAYKVAPRRNAPSRAVSCAGSEPGEIGAFDAAIGKASREAFSLESGAEPG
jgi:hypothetical protein